MSRLILFLLLLVSCGSYSADVSEQVKRDLLSQLLTFQQALVNDNVSQIQPMISQEAYSSFSVSAQPLNDTTELLSHLSLIKRINIDLDNLNLSLTPVSDSSCRLNMESYFVGPGLAGFLDNDDEFDSYGIQLVFIFSGQKANIEQPACQYLDVYNFLLAEKLLKFTEKSVLPYQ